MQLNGSSVRNLELFRNQTDGKERGSLLWVLNQTNTRFGSRLLRHWIAKPLRSVEEIRRRLEAVQELTEAPACMARLQSVLLTLPDVEKALATIVHGKCSSSDFYQACDALHRVEQTVKQESPQVQQLNSSLLRSLMTDIGELLDGVGDWVNGLNSSAAKSGDKTQIFCDETQFPELVAVKENINATLTGIHNHRRDIRLQLKMPALDYTTVLGVEFMVEIKNTNLKIVPHDWQKISSTKAVSRFHTPFIVEAYKELSQQREQLQITANQCWRKYLTLFERCYPGYRRAVHHLAAIDCLMSLAHVAKKHGYVK